jgi:hypothetical protein
MGTTVLRVDEGSPPTTLVGATPAGLPFLSPKARLSAVPGTTVYSPGGVPSSSGSNVGRNLDRLLHCFIFSTSQFSHVFVSSLLMSVLPPVLVELQLVRLFYGVSAQVPAHGLRSPLVMLSGARYVLSLLVYRSLAALVSLGCCLGFLSFPVACFLAFNCG